jgi:hypothetical protein
MSRCVGRWQPGALRLAIPLLPRARALWRSQMSFWSDPYRPELHYMRGPGPKFHELQARRALMTDKEVPLSKGETHKYCPKCAALVVLERVMPSFGPLPEIRIYKCLSCGSMVDETIHR